MAIQIKNNGLINISVFHSSPISTPTYRLPESDKFHGGIPKPSSATINPTSRLLTHLAPLTQAKTWLLALQVPSLSPHNLIYPPKYSLAAGKATQNSLTTFQSPVQLRPHRSGLSCLTWASQEFLSLKITLPASMTLVLALQSKWQCMFQIKKTF